MNDAAPDPEPDRLSAGRVSAVPGYRRWVAALLVGAALLVPYVLVSLRRHALLQTSGFDLALFTQYAAGFAAGELIPGSAVRGPGWVLYGDHTSPVLMLLGPLYAVFPHTETLLVAQAVLFGVSVVWFCWFAQRLGGPLGVGLGLAYGLSYGVVGAVAFDFHEIAFAMPLLTGALIAVVTRRWVWALVLAAALLLVKEDLGLTAAAVAGIVALRRLPPLRRWPGFGRLARAAGLEVPARRTVSWPGAIAAVVVAAGCLVAVVVLVTTVIPAFNPDGVYPHGGTGRGVLGVLAGVPDGWPVKVGTLMVLAVAGGVIALRSSLMLAVVPALAARLASDSSFNWEIGFHYDALLMPVVFLALVEVLGRPVGPAARRAALWCVTVLTVWGTAVGPLAMLSRSDTWIPTDDVVAVHGLLARIPDRASVQATNQLAAQLADRTDVSLLGTFTWERPERPDYLIADRLDPVGRMTPAELEVVLGAAPANGYCLDDEVRGDRRDVVLYRRC